jgi:hypothetical protein
MSSPTIVSRSENLTERDACEGRQIAGAPFRSSSRHFSGTALPAFRVVDGRLAADRLREAAELVNRGVSMAKVNLMTPRNRR